MPSTNDALIRQLLVQDALLKHHAEESLASFVRQAWPVLEPSTPLLWNWHIDLICEHLEAVSAGEIRRLLINLPPRYMKSLLVSVFWPTWEWIRDPGGRWIFSSYAEKVSLKHSVDRRTLLQSDWFRARWQQRVRLAADQNVKGEFSNAARGSMIVTSTGGSITGKGGNRLVIDDPHNPTETESEVQRGAVINHFRRTLSTRLDDKKCAAIILVMQRLHEDDLSALCQGLDYTHVSLPVEAETKTTIVFPRSHRELVRDVGDLLWPEREGRPELAQQKQILGTAAFAGQYLQRPAPSGGLIFQRDGFKFYDELPSMDQFALSVDASFKDTPDSDYVVGIAAARHGARIYLLDRIKGRWAFGESCRQIRAMLTKHPQVRRVYIEEAANGPAIIDALGRQVPGVIAVRPDGGKLARAHAAAPRVEAGQVYLPNPRPHGVLMPERQWVDDFLYQLTVFPRGAHDDDVDAFTQLLVKWQKPMVSCVW